MLCPHDVEYLSQRLLVLAREQLADPGLKYIVRYVSIALAPLTNVLYSVGRVMLDQAYIKY